MLVGSKKQDLGDFGVISKNASASENVPQAQPELSQPKVVLTKPVVPPLVVTAPKPKVTATVSSTTKKQKKSSKKRKQIVYNTTDENDNDTCALETKKCFYGSVKNVTALLEKSALMYASLCAPETKPRISRLMELAGIIGYTEGYSKINLNKIPQDVKLSIKSLNEYTEFKFIGYLKELQSSFHEDILRNPIIDRLWLAISDELDATVKSNNYPFFLRRNVWQYMQNIRMVNMLKMSFSYNSESCLPTTWKFINNIWEMSSTPNLVSVFKPISKNCPADTLEIIPENFINGGIVFTFWGQENLSSIKKRSKTIFSGYLSNKLVYEWALTKGNGEVVHEFKLLNDVIKISSGSNCADYFFVTLAIQKDCDKYNIYYSVRFLAANDRKSGFRSVFADKIEYTTFKFDNSITFNHHLFRNVKYTPEQELYFMSYTSNANLVKNLQTRSICENQNGKCVYSDLANCLICRRPFLKFQGKCYPECPDGYYNSGKGNCKPCAPQCENCSGPKNGQCLSCRKNLFMNKGTCVSTCPDDMAANAKKFCVKCGDNCVRCKDITTCAKCAAEHFLKNGKCVPNCGLGFYPSYQPNSCNICPTGCTECTSSKLCQSCAKGFFMKNGLCVRNCGEKYFANISTNTCDPCNIGCLTCNNSKTCLTCDKGLTFSKKTLLCENKCGKGKVKINGACVPCGDKNCERCSPSNTNECLKCNGTTFLKFGKCLNSCGEGFYVDDKRRCQPCTKDCKICTKDKCLQCFNNKVIFKENTCLIKCVDGYVKSGNVCVKCDNPAVCRRCKPNELGTCTKCYPGSVLYAGKCLNSCPPKFYKKGDVCAPCIKGCEVCENNYRCKKCSNDWFLKHHVCVDCCGSGYTNDNGVCKRCNVRDCDVCNPGNLGKCEKCIQNKYLYNNQCHKVCPLGTYPNKVGGCEKCSQDCAICKDKETCTKCVAGKVLQGKVCQSVCNDGYVNVNGICTPCKNIRCKKCGIEKLVECTECPLGSFLYQGDCVKVCPDGTYLSKGVCERCVKPCAECKDKNTCTSCIRGFFLYQGKCTDNCPDYHTSRNGKCEKCADIYCKKCTSADLTTCIICDATHYLHSGKCLKVCHKGFYSKDMVCQPCSIGCASCKK